MKGTTTGFVLFLVYVRDVVLRTTPFQLTCPKQPPLATQSLKIEVSSVYIELHK